MLHDTLNAATLIIQTWTLSEPKGKVPTTGMELWDLSETWSTEGVESVLASSGWAEWPAVLGASAVGLLEAMASANSCSPLKFSGWVICLSPSLEAMAWLW